jgi:hypothetical protein
MRPLLEALATWRGPEEVGKEIARRGFLVPQAYRHLMIAYCDSVGFASDLETYWSERAREKVLCGGRVDSDGRRFLGEVAYRSAYLDRLAIERETLPKSRMAVLHPCLRRWAEEKQGTDGQLARSLWQKLDELKEAERERYGILGDGWTGKKRGVVPLLRSYAQSLGFEEKYLPVRGFDKGKALCKQMPSGLIFYCWVDTGGHPEARHRLPLYFFVSHVDETFLPPDFDPRVDESYPPLGAAPDTMYAGAEYYSVFETQEMAVFGIFALVEIFDAFFSTFQ